MSPSLHLASRTAGEIFRLSGISYFFFPSDPNCLRYAGILADGSIRYSLNVASLHRIPEFLFTSL